MWFNYNVIFVPAAVLGYDKATADFDAVAALIRDKYLLHQLRDRRGAYGAFIYIKDEGIYIYSYRDPNIAEAYAPLFRILADNYNSYTAGSASAIAQVSGMFEEIMDSFGI